MITDRINMAFVEAHKLDVWIRDVDTKGGKVLFIVPHAYLFEQDNLSRTQQIRMAVETHRVIYTLPETISDSLRRAVEEGPDE